MSLLSDLSRGIGRRWRGRGAYDTFENLSSEQLATVMLKAFANPQIGNSVWDEPNIKEDHPWQNDEAMRRAIHSMSNYYNVLGVYRSDFDKQANDTMANNAYYSVMEKRLMDSISIMSWKVVDKGGDIQDDAMDFLEYPNPQDSFSDILKATTSDLLRYDAATIVKSFSRKGKAVELKAYPGTEFWKEIDRVPVGVNMGNPGIMPEQSKMIGLWSHGYTQRYWQRSKPGVYISFDPEELVYMSMYRRADNIYGTDFITRMKYQIQYLIDSTRAAGRTFSNGIVPSLVWNHPQVPDFNSLLQRIEEVKANNQGSYRFGSTLHTVGEEKVETLSHTLHDMEWLAGQQFVASLVWAMYGYKPSDFIDQDTNRATAYVSHMSTKSASLFPILRYYETMITREVLPYLDGYQKGWKFTFIKDVDLDDELKQAEIAAQKANTFSMYVTAGIAPESALKLAQVIDDTETIEVEFEPLPMMDAGGPGDQGSATNHKGAGDKKFASSSTSTRPEKMPQPGNYKITFGDKEEKSAGIQKGTRYIKLHKEGVDITIVPKSPCIYTNRKHEAIELGHELKRQIMRKTGHSRPQMMRHAVWNKILPKFCEDHGLDREDAEYGVEE